MTGGAFSLCRSQTLTPTRNSLAASNHRSSEERATVYGFPLGFRGLRCLPVSMSQSRTVASWLLVITLLPLDVTRMESTPAEWASGVANLSRFVAISQKWSAVLPPFVASVRPSGENTAAFQSLTPTLLECLAPYFIASR